MPGSHDVQTAARQAALVAFLTGAFLRPCLADPPQVKSLFPRGGQTGSTVEVTVDGKLTAGDRIHCTQPGVTGTVSEDGKKVTLTLSEDATPGLCFLRFFNASGAASPVPFVIGRLPELMETEPNPRPEKAQPLDSSCVINGKLAESADTDVFSIRVPAGRTLVASCDANWRLNSPVDPVMQVLDERGVVLTQVDDDRGFDPLIAWPCDQDTTLLVRLFGFPATPNSSIRFSNSSEYVYRLTLTTDAWPNHAMPSAVQTDQPQPLSITGWNIPDVLRHPAPDTVQTSLHPSASDPAVGRMTLPDLPVDLPVYTVPHPVIILREPNSLESPLILENYPVTLCGVIDDSGDEDSFQLTVAKGEKLTFHVESRTDGHALDAVLRIFDGEGKLLMESDDAARDVFDPVAKYTARADGPIRVSVTDRFGQGNWRYAYRLHVRPLEPAAAATVKSDHYVIAAGESVDIPVTVSRNDGFSEEIEFVAEGLPEGVTCEPVQSEAKGDSAKSVTLKLVAGESAGASSGNIRVVGRYSDSATVTATADINGGQSRLPAVWLTVTPKTSTEDEDASSGDPEND